MDDYDGCRRCKSVLGAAGLRDLDGGARCKAVVVRIVFWPIETEGKVAVSGACYSEGRCESVVVRVAGLCDLYGGGRCKVVGRGALFRVLVMAKGGAIQLW